MALHVSPWLLLLLLTALTASVIQTSATGADADKPVALTDDSFVGTERALQKHCHGMCTLCMSYLCTPACLALVMHPRKVLNKSCKDILDGADEGTLKDDVYTIDVAGNETKVYCDMTRDGGGWTLIVTTRTPNGWRAKDTLYERNIASPSLDQDYSILGLADSIKKNAKGKTFEYRIEGNGRGQWGGIWQAPVSYTFTSTNKLQTDIKLTKMFGTWKYKTSGIEKRMPWIDLKSTECLLTTDGGTGSWWGTFMIKDSASSGEKSSWNVGPWISGKKGGQKLNMAFYWLREN